MNTCHPLWLTLHWLVVILAIGFVLWINASEFDETELKSLAQIAIGLGGLFGLQGVLHKQKKEK